jgi:hypothetical protein
MVARIVKDRKVSLVIVGQAFSQAFSLSLAFFRSLLDVRSDQRFGAPPRRSALVGRGGSRERKVPNLVFLGVSAPRRLTRLSHLGAYSTGKPFVFSGRFAKVCTTF